MPTILSDDSTYQIDVLGRSNGQTVLNRFDFYVTLGGTGTMEGLLGRFRTNFTTYMLPSLADTYQGDALSIRRITGAVRVITPRRTYSKRVYGIKIVDFTWALAVGGAAGRARPLFATVNAELVCDRTSILFKGHKEFSPTVPDPLANPDMNRLVEAERDAWSVILENFRSFAGNWTGIGTASGVEWGLFSTVLLASGTGPLTVGGCTDVIRNVRVMPYLGSNVHRKEKNAAA